MDKEFVILAASTENEIYKALKTANGVLLKSITKYEGGQSESIVELKDAVLVNHGTATEPVWKLNR